MKKNKKLLPESGLFQKLSIPLAVLLIIQMTVLLLVVQVFAISGLKENKQAVTSAIVESRKKELQNTFVKWTKLDYAIDEVNGIYESYAAEEKDILQPDTQPGFFCDVYDILVSVLRQNSVNGAYIILNDSYSYTPYEEGAERWGLGIRDYDSKSSYIATEDIVAIRSSVSTQDALGSKAATKDSGWDNKYRFESEIVSEFFYKPLYQAFLNPEADSSFLGFYATPTRLGNNDGMEHISYSVPLIYNGKPYGVLGIEVSSSHFTSQLPFAELGSPEDVAYVIAKNTDTDSDYKAFIQSGSYYIKAFGSNKEIVTASHIGKNTYTFKNLGNNKDTLGFVAELQLYEKNSPFDNEAYSLIGLSSANVLYEGINRFNLIFMASAVLTLLFGLLGVMMISAFITTPIKKLALNVQKIDADSDVMLNHIGIKEIDGLIVSIEQMHIRITENLAKTEFFARMSHDMRTPMNAIIGFSDDGIVKNASKEEITDYLGKINTSGKYLLSLINDVLDMSKISSGKLEMMFEAVPFYDFIDSTLSIIREIAEQKGVIFTVEGLTEKLKNRILSVDKYRMQQIFTNLLSNAVKFTPPGNTVVFSIRELSDDGKCLKIEYKITDTGCGMSAEFLQNLYKPFLQEHPGSGTGLGLSISKNLIDILGGTVDCVSEVGKGTCFTVVLEHTASAGEALTKTEETTRTDYLLLYNKRVLLCEDNIINTQIAMLQITNVGMIAEHAQDGEIAVDMFAKSDIGYYDAVLMDIHMPNKNGLQATNDIRALDRADAKTVPIIAMTANAFPEDVTESVKAGMNAHLAKPINPAILYETLIKFIGSKTDGE